MFKNIKKMVNALDNGGFFMAGELLTTYRLTIYPIITNRSIIINGKELPTNEPIGIHTIDIADTLSDIELESIMEIEINNKKYSVANFIDNVIGIECFALAKFNKQLAKEPQYAEYFHKEYLWRLGEIKYGKYITSLSELRKQRVIDAQKERIKENNAKIYAAYEAAGGNRRNYEFYGGVSKLNNFIENLLHENKSEFI